MKTVLLLIIAIVSILITSNFSIHFKPFKISFESPYMAIGIILFGIGLGFLMYQSRIDGEKKGFEHCIELLKEINKESKEGTK
jgi:small neutral amino acid transporter SnatA (MarC family)